MSPLATGIGKIALINSSKNTIVSIPPVSAAVDPLFSNVSLLLHMDGVNNSTTFTDVSLTPKTITPNGDAKISLTQSKFGEASASFDGNGDYLTSSSNTGFQFGTGDFAIEMWARFNAISNQCLYDSIPIGGSGRRLAGFTWVLKSDGKLDVYSSDSFRGASTTTLSSNTWYHLALVRSGSTWTHYINGVADASYTHSLDVTDSTFLCGRVGDSADYYVNGYIDEYRITKAARYTSNFTPPTAAFPPVVDPLFSNVLLLLHMDGTNNSTIFTDNSSNNFSLSKTGTTSIKTAQSKFGGASIFFDGTLSSVITSQNASLAFGTGDFTVECFARPATTSAGTLASSRAVSGNNNNYWALYIDSAKLTLQVRDANATQYFASSANSTISADTWYHLAAVRSNNVITVFIDGVAGPTTASVTGVSLLEQYIGIGIFNYTGFAGSFNGYIDEIRITKAARYTTNFIPPTAAFPNS